MRTIDQQTGNKNRRSSERADCNYKYQRRQKVYDKIVRNTNKGKKGDK